jgi:hypothetical protein
MILGSRVQVLQKLGTKGYHWHCNAAILILAVGFLLYAIRWGTTLFVNFSIGDIWGNDFFAIWSFAKFAASKPVVQIYDNGVIHDFQTDLGAYPWYYLPFAYAPSFVFAILPLGFMPST